MTAGALTLCCADMDAMPLFRTLPGGGREGYEPAAAGAVADHLGLELVWSFHRWDRFRPALEAGEVDAIWCGSAITEERRSVFSYSQPYGAFDEAVLVRADSGIGSAQDLAGRSIGAIAGSTNMRLAESLGAGRLVGFDGTSDDVFAEMVEAVRERRLDAMVDDEPAFGSVTADGELAIAHVAPSQNPWGAACRLGDERMVTLIDRGIGLARADGSLAAAWRRFMGTRAVPAAILPA